MWCAEQLRSMNCQVARNTTDNRQKAMPAPSAMARPCDSPVSQRIGAGQPGGAHWCGRASPGLFSRMETSGPRFGSTGFFAESSLNVRSLLLAGAIVSQQLLHLFAEL